MLPVSWNPHQFHIVTKLPPRASFNASWFIDGNRVPLVEKFTPAGWSAERRKLIVCIDNALAHSSRTNQNFFWHNRLYRLPHPPFSPDISPSDLYLFGKVNSMLIGREAQ
jgi:hypothetical protein